MHTDYKQILLRFDEIGAFETPKNFNKKKLKNQVLLLHKNLEKQFNTSLSIDSHIEDASFFCDIIIPNQLTTTSSSIYYAVRISNFGNLATITVWDLAVYEFIKNLVYKIEETGFIYIPVNELDTVYDGAFDHFKSELHGSWWIRYFDYL